MNGHLMLLEFLRAIKRVISVFAVSAILYGCTSNGSKPPGPQINIDSHAVKSNPKDTAFWMMFAMAKSGCEKDYPAYSYGVFSCAFKMASLITTLKKTNLKNQPVNSSPTSTA